MPFGFRPKLLDSLKGYTRADFGSDVVAGLTVGLVALPLAMALAIATGLKPEVGLWTAVVAGFLISALGGSRVQVGGPAGAFIAILAPIVALHGPEGLVVCTFLSGCMLLVMGGVGMGTMIRFIPFPVVTGFTSGIAIIILSTQINDFFGLGLKGLSAEFVPKMVVIAGHFRPSPAAAILATACLLLILFWPARWARRVPGSIAAILLSAVAVYLFKLDAAPGIETIGTKFGGLTQGFPLPHWPSLSLEKWPSLMRDAFTIAILGAIESLLCAVVADGMIDDRHNSNQELMAQGIANIGSALFGGMAATGVLARTATNIRSGARTPVAGVVHALTILMVLLILAPLAKFIPLAGLAAVLVVVAFRMGEWHQFTRIRKWPKSDAATFLTAFILTVIADLTLAVGAGMLLASALLIKRISDTSDVAADEEVTHAESPEQTTQGKVVPKGVLVFRVFGAFFFGAADKLETALHRAGQEPEVLILRMRDVLALDATGLDALEDLFEKMSKHRRQLILCGPHMQPYFALERAGFFDRLGRENLCADMDAALTRAREILAAKSK
jgi:SulP family sulfate permease